MTAHQRKHLVVQLLRDAMRLGVLALVVLIVYLSLYAHYRAARALEDEQFLTGVNGKVLRQIDDRVATMDDPQAFLDGYKGTLWSMRLAGVDIADPLAAAEMTATAKTIHWPLLMSILIPVVITLVLGRVFCSWMCPAGLLFEWSQKLRRLLRLAETKPGEVKFAHGNKYVVVAIGLLVGVVFGLPIFALIYPPAVASRLVHALIFGTSFTGMVVLLAVIVVFEVFVSPRWWCRTMCPGGAIYALLSWPRLWRVRLLKSKCTGCGDCEPICPMGLYPVTQCHTIECDNCGVCLRHCPDDALVYTIGLPGEKRRRKGQPGGGNGKPQRTAAVATIIVAATLLLPAGAAAHHILGLPHYSYKENYPQVPTLEYPATTGPYDVLMTSYPGKPAPGEPANVAFYIKNRNDDKPYDQPVTIRVLQTYTFGRNREVVTATRLDPLDKTHKLSVTYPEDGEFIVELSMEVEGQTEVIPFLMIAGEPSATGSVLAAIAIGLGLFIVVVRAIKIKRACAAGRASEPDTTPAADTSTAAGLT